MEVYDAAVEVARDPSILTRLAGHAADVLDMFDASQLSIGAFIAVMASLIVRRMVKRGSKTRNIRKP